MLESEFNEILLKCILYTDYEECKYNCEFEYDFKLCDIENIIIKKCLYMLIEKKIIINHFYAIT